MRTRLIPVGALFALGLTLAPHLSLAQETGQGPVLLESPQATLDASTFLQRATQTNLSEIQLGNLALQRSQNEAVRSLAQRIIADHTESQGILCGLPAVQEGALPQAPSIEQRAIIEQLSTLQGEEFDREFVRVLISEHEKAIAQFEQAAGAVDDPEVRSYAASQLPGLQEHLAQARALQDELSIGGLTR